MNRCLLFVSLLTWSGCLLSEESPETPELNNVNNINNDNNDNNENNGNNENNTPTNNNVVVNNNLPDTVVAVDITKNGETFFYASSSEFGVEIWSSNEELPVLVKPGVSFQLEIAANANFLWVLVDDDLYECNLGNFEDCQETGFSALPPAAIGADQDGYYVAHPVDAGYVVSSDGSDDVELKEGSDVSAFSGPNGVLFAVSGDETRVFTSGGNSSCDRGAFIKAFPTGVDRVLGIRPSGIVEDSWCSGPSMFPTTPVTLALDIAQTSDGPVAIAVEIDRIVVADRTGLIDTFSFGPTDLVSDIAIEATDDRVEYLYVLNGELTSGGAAL